MLIFKTEDFRIILFITRYNNTYLLINKPK